MRREVSVSRDHAFQRLSEADTANRCTARSPGVKEDPERNDFSDKRARADQKLGAHRVIVAKGLASEEAPKIPVPFARGHMGSS